MAGIVVRPRARILHGHDWVFRNELLKVFGEPADGDVISIKDGRDRLLGSAIWNSKSQIVARRFSRRRQELDIDFFRRRIQRAEDYRRRRSVDPDLHRVVWSESDGLPGVIIDRYGDQFVVQITTLGMDLRKDLICRAISESLDAGTIIERNDTASRRAEGLGESVRVVLGSARPAQFEVGGVGFQVDLLGAQKTGFYLDQLPHYEAIGNVARGRRILDCFTNQGAFALIAARAGAAEVIGVESQPDPIAASRENAKRNKLSVRWVEQDVFAYLREAEKTNAQFDLIILDPPAFTKGKGAVRDAMRGYRELHLRAFKLLSRDGLLATFSCSHHISDTILCETVTAALVDARRSARKWRHFEQAPDHPVVPTVPETQYFTGLLLEMMASM